MNSAPFDEVQTQEKVLLSGWHAEAFIKIVATHEAGHVVMGLQFGVESKVELDFTPSGEFIGATCFGLGSFKTYTHSSCASWGGIVAEYLFGWILDPVPGIPKLTLKSADKWAMAILTGGVINSADLAAIKLSPDPKEDAIFTVRILSSMHGGGLHFRQAKRMEAEFRKQLQRDGQLVFELSPKSPYLLTEKRRAKLCKINGVLTGSGRLA